MELTQRVIDEGYRDIIMIIGSLDETSSNQRLIGFQNCLRANNIEWTHDRVYFGDCHYKSGFEIAEDLISRNRVFMLIIIWKHMGHMQRSKNTESVYPRISRWFVLTARIQYSCRIRT